MKIEEFFTKSEGEWISMRSSHSLAFKQFENVISQIKISSISLDDAEVLDLVNSYDKQNERHASPLLIEWESDSDWEEEDLASMFIQLGILDTSHLAIIPSSFITDSASWALFNKD